MRVISLLTVVVMPLVSVACISGRQPTPDEENSAPQEVLRGAPPRRVAELHYKAVVRGDRELWLATLSRDNREVADRRGSYPDLWWQTGRRYAVQYGVTYRFQKVAEESPKRVKLFFVRLNPDGSQRGMPVPIHLIKEEEGWRVDGVTY